MIKVPGYRIVNQIYASPRTLVYRGIKESNQQAVIIKLLSNKYPSFSELVQFRNAYAIAKNLKYPGILSPLSLENYQNGLALVMEDFGGISLQVWQQQNQELPIANFLPEFFRIAIQLAQVLERLYQNRIIHKDIKPQNILINPETKQIKLIDFSIASLLPRESQEIQNPNVLEGTLAYMSPEQTGRMNRGIDYRTDFYSLGVTFYELLTGQLPFPSNDPMELVHCHIARQPMPVCEVNSAIPQAVCDIVMKLMAKTAEERYQSASGLKHDLETCLKQWESNGRIEAFTVGKRDISDRFIIREKLYGRETEEATLLAAFDRVALGTTEMMLVAGFSGIGKSSLVNEIHKPIVRQRGYFIKGKFDQFGRNIPFSAFLQAFRDLMEQLLTESDALLVQWKAKILSALGEQGKVITEVIPELESIIGKQPEVSLLEAPAAQNRFNLLFGKFISVFATKEHPLVIFLDDLQWADSASLKLIHLLMSETDTCYLLLIGAYRDNEVSPAHPLMLILGELRKTKATINTITLAALSLADLNHLVADTLSCPVPIARPLTQLIYTKTKGNPFFTNQFLKALYEDELITFNFEAGYWQCDITQVRALSLTDDVVEFMALQLQKLPADTQEVLKLAACIGNSFDLGTLAIVREKSQTETATELWKALQEGLILPKSEIYKFFTDDGELGSSHAAEYLKSRMTADQSLNYKFFHDRVQQAAYFLIPENQKQSTHLKIGELLLSNTPAEAREERIFEIVNQLNTGKELIAGQTERDELAQLNLIAGRKAKASTAYGAAVRYLTVGMELLATDSWIRQYELSFDFYKERSEVEYLNGNFDKSEELISLALEQAKSPIYKAEIYNLLLVQYNLRTKYFEAIEAGRKALKLLGIDLSENNFTAVLDSEIAAIDKRLENREIASLIDEKEMTDSTYRVAMKLLANIQPPSYFVHQELWAVIIVKMVSISLQYGHVPESSFGYAGYCNIMGSKFSNYQSCYEFGRLALKLSDKLHSPVYKCRNAAAFVAMTNHWRKPIKSVFSVTHEAYQAGIDSGELQFAGYILAYQSLPLFYAAENLENLRENLIKYLYFTKKTKNQVATDVILGLKIAVENLSGLTEGEFILAPEGISEAQYLSRCRENKNLMVVCFYQIFKSQILYLYEQPLSALSCILEAKELLSFIPGFICLAEHNFFYSLSMAAIYAEASPEAKEQYLRQIETNQKQMKIWADNCPENFLHKFLLVEAEVARITDENWEAIDLYDRAIASAKEQEFVQNEGLANELAAKFWLSKSKDKMAQNYMIDAYYDYARWGAKAKLIDLEQRYPQLLSPILEQQKISLNPCDTLAIATSNSLSSSGNFNSLISTSTTISNVLDLGTVIKASQALFSEINLDKLLLNLMQVVTENAGADKCALMLVKGDTLAIEAISSIKEDQNSEPPIILQSIPVEESQDIPYKLINYVKRTSETVVIDDISTATHLVADPYILSQQPKSLLCTPIVNQGKLTGILYLENSLTTGAFTRDRLALLRLIVSQVAISIENARLYNNLAIAKAQLECYNQTLEQRVKEKTQEIQAKNLHLSETLDKLQRTQTQLIQAEKMSSLGQMIAGIAHEINNPVNFIYGNLTHAEDYFENLLRLIYLYQEHYPNPVLEIEDMLSEIELNFLVEDLPKIIQSMKLGTDRIRNIVLSLRNFSRLDEAEMKPVDIHSGIDSTLLILQHRLRGDINHAEIEIIKEYGQIPELTCYAAQLNQVFMNILSNAIDALKAARDTKANHKPAITIHTELSDRNSVVIRIVDNGQGIKEDILPRIFDPFFTTKPVGHGTGLGLSISYQIVVEKHGGQLTCSSTVGQGTQFRIEIPIR